MGDTLRRFRHGHRMTTTCVSIRPPRPPGATQEPITQRTRGSRDPRVTDRRSYFWSTGTLLADGHRVPGADRQLQASTSTN